MIGVQPEIVTLIMTGASGAQYGLRLLEVLVQKGIQINLLMSRPGQLVINMETDLKVPSRAKEVQEYFTDLYGADPGQIRAYEREQWMSPVASGSGVADATVVCPCTSGTLSAIAVGASWDNDEEQDSVAANDADNFEMEVGCDPEEISDAKVSLSDVERMMQSRGLDMPKAADPAEQK
jgi:4-hydroxy-3-polyprenylbenzoate decarboxylase